MRKLLIIAAALLVSTSAYAQVSCNTFNSGPNSWTNCSDGTRANTFNAGPNSWTTITPPPPVYTPPPAPSYSTKQCSWDYIRNRPC